MVDDLTLQGVTEPYRMLTARAEYRLRLRADNAEARLAPKAIAAACVSEGRLQHYRERESERTVIEALLGEVRSGTALQAHGIAVREDGVKRALGEWFRFPEMNRETVLRVVPELSRFKSSLLEEAIEDHRYAPYLQRQDAEVTRLLGDEAVRIPADLDYARVAGLSSEMTERLSLARPATLGAARRVRGVTPAALAAILVHARKKAA
jgi:tRNA uridine 5-carboxymethylaminomethyl modification enzyme